MKTYQDVEAALAKFVAPASELVGRDITVDRTVRLAAHVGNPHERLRVVHVAGTSGKTSTCYYTAELLRASGVRVGLTVSPHIRCIGERVQINGELIGEATFSRYMEEFLQLLTAYGEKPSYYELMMTLALWVFEREHVDYAVIETGLGGLHDSTNICRRSDKLSVITDIGYDHMQILGSTLGEISAQKAGIIAEGNHVVTYEQSSEVMEPIQEACRHYGATLHIEHPPETEDFRERNFRLARAVYSVLQKRDGLSRLTNEQVHTARRVEIPGRLVTFQRADSTILIDGAHNEQKMTALIRALRSLYPDQKFAVILAMKQGKEYKEVIAQLAPLVSRVVVTSFEAVQDSHIRSVEPELLQTEFEKYGIKSSINYSLTASVDQLVAEKHPFVLATGSLYAAAELLQ